MLGFGDSAESRAMSQLYEEYRLYVHKLAWQYSNPNSEVDDLIQDVWVKICEKAILVSQLEKKQQLVYLSTVVRNTVYSASRMRVNFEPLETVSGLEYYETEVLNRILDRKLSIDRFRQIWPYVPEDARVVLERKYVLGESDAQIAAAMGIHKNSVRMYLSRARKIAWAVLGEYKDLLL